MKIKYYLIVILLLSINVRADFSYSNNKLVKINEIDLISKIVYYTENGKNHKAPYSMELLEEVYYKSTSEKYELSKLPVKKNFYISLRSQIDENSKSGKMNNFVIYYIGTVPYPF